MSEALLNAVELAVERLKRKAANRVRYERRYARNAPPPPGKPRVERKIRLPDSIGSLRTGGTAPMGERTDPAALQKRLFNPRELYALLLGRHLKLPKKIRPPHVAHQGKQEMARRAKRGR